MKIQISDDWLFGIGVVVVMLAGIAGCVHYDRIATAQRMGIIRQMDPLWQNFYAQLDYLNGPGGLKFARSYITDNAAKLHAAPPITTEQAMTIESVSGIDERGEVAGMLSTFEVGPQQR